MDWKAKLASTIKAAVQAGVKAALERSMYASVEESADETARRRSSWLGEAGRHHIELVEDRARRDPVWAEKLARRHAAFHDTLPSTVAPAPTPCTVSVAIVPERCCFDPETVAANSTSTMPASILSACVVRDGDLDLTSPTTCSSLCPGGDTSAVAASMLASVVLGEPAVTTACTARDGCIYPVAHPVATPRPVPVDVADGASTVVVIMAPPTIRSAVYHELVPDAPAVVVTQAMLQSADFSSSGAWVSMSTQLDKPDGAGAIVMHEDEQLLTCSRMERPLTLVSSWEVADDDSFVTRTSAMPLTLAALGVDNDHIANKHNVLLPLKLLELSMSESKEPFMTSLPPQFTQVIVTWGTYVNQLHTKCSGSHDHPKKSGISSIVSAHCTSNALLLVLLDILQFVLNKCPLRTSCGDLLVLFSRTFIHGILKSPSACHCQTGSIPYQYVLVPAGMVCPYGSVSLPWKMCWSSLFDVLRAIQSTAELCSCIVWSRAAVLLFFSMEIQILKGPMKQWDPGIVRGFHFSTQDYSVSCRLIYIAVTTELAHNKLIQTGFQLYTTNYALLHGHAYIHLGIAMLFSVGCPAGGDIFTYSTYNPSDVTSLLTSIESTVQAFAWNIVRSWKVVWSEYCFFTAVQHVLCPTRPHAHISVSRPDDDSLYVPVRGQECITFLQASTSSCFIEYSSLIDCELLHWKIAWSLYLVCSTSGNKNGELFHPTELRCEGYLAKRNTALQPFSTRTVQVLLPVIWSRAHHTGTYGCHYLTSGTVRAVPFQFLAYVAMWSFRSLKFCQGELSWGPAILCLFGLFTQVCADHDYYLDLIHHQVHTGHDYYIGVFSEQVRARRYLNLIKVCLDYGTHRNLGKVLRHQVPWDPDGSTWHRLEVNPKFKEGGMLVTYFPMITVGWTMSCLTGLGLLGIHMRQYLHIQGDSLRTRRLGTGWLRPPQLLSSPSSLVPLPVMART